MRHLPDRTMPEQTFTKEELAQLFQRAAERQAADAPAGPAPRLSYDEVERIGAEAGLAPHHLRSAAAEVERARRTARRAAADGPLASEERVVPGTLTDALWTDVRSELRHALGTGGGRETTHADAGVREWAFTGEDDGETRATLTERDGRLHLRLTRRRGQHETALWRYGTVSVAVAALYALVAGLTTSSAFVGVVVLLNAVLVVLAGLWVAERVGRRRQRRRLQEVGDRVEALVEREAAGAPPLTAPAPAAPVLTLDALPDAPDAASGRAGLRTRP